MATERLPVAPGLRPCRRYPPGYKPESGAGPVAWEDSSTVPVVLAGCGRLGLAGLSALISS